MNWLLVGEIVYTIVVILACLRILHDTRSTTKTMSYLLLVIFLPVIGIILYFSIGINYRNRKIYSKKLVSELRSDGVQAVPFYKIKLILLANRINYRNHRKIIVVDGSEAFVGGINVSDDYINYEGDDEPAWWRDMHLYMAGPVVHYMQYLFMGDWNFCANDNLEPTEAYFPNFNHIHHPEDRHMQIVASGPVSDSPAILYSILQGVMLAKSEILITTPYFIPGESLMDLLVISAKSGVDVHILIPAVGDSVLVNSAAQ